MERRPYGSNGDSTSRRISYRIKEELRTSDKDDRRNTKGDEEAIQQKKVESSRTKGWRQCVAGKQEYPFKLTLKEVG